MEKNMATFSYNRVCIGVIVGNKGIHLIGIIQGVYSLIPY